jgi:hypothetical protein
VMFHCARIDAIREGASTLFMMLEKGRQIYT